MADLTNEVVIGQIRAVLREAFEGPPDRWSYFTDQGSGAGFFGTLAGLTAAEASRPWARTTIAAHTHHVVFSLEASASWIRGERIRRNWDDSWRVVMVDETEWSRLRDDLRLRYEELCRAIEEHATSGGEEAFGGAIGAVAHMAYHLGAIRQKVAHGRHA